MDVVSGVISLVVVIILSFFARRFIVSSGIRKNRVVYKGLKIINYESPPPGIMVYTISIVTAIIGPFSFRIYPMNDLTYVILNAVAAVFFVAFYPRFAPITGFSTIDLIEKEGKLFCVVGKVMNRRFKVLSISEKPKFEIVIENGRNKSTFEVMSPSVSPR